MSPSKKLDVSLRERIIREMVGCQFCGDVATHSEIVVTCGEHKGEVNRLYRLSKVLTFQVDEARVKERKQE